MSARIQIAEVINEHVQEGEASRAGSPKLKA